MTRFRILASAVLILGLALPVAARTQRELAHRWVGAHVVVEDAVRSNCDGYFTDNSVRADLTAGRGRHFFDEGELARVQKVDVKRKRVDVLLQLVEPVLFSYRDGPFTLYREGSCKIELEIAVPRSVIRSRDAGALDARISDLLTRFTTERAARDSELWNGRVTEALPDDYARTLRAHAAWKAEQNNLLVDERRQLAVAQAAVAIEALFDEPDYLAGFSEGVAEGRAWAGSLNNCSKLIGSREPGERLSTEDPEPSEIWKRGFVNGRRLAYWVTLGDRLNGCYVDVPPVDDEDAGVGFLSKAEPPRR